MCKTHLKPPGSASVSLRWGNRSPHSTGSQAGLKVLQRKQRMRSNWMVWVDLLWTFSAVKYMTGCLRWIGWDSLLIMSISASVHLCIRFVMCAQASCGCTLRAASSAWAPQNERCVRCIFVDKEASQNTSQIVSPQREFIWEKEWLQAKPFSKSMHPRAKVRLHYLYLYLCPRGQIVSPEERRQKEEQKMNHPHKEKRNGLPFLCPSFIFDRWETGCI